MSPSGATLKPYVFRHRSAILSLWQVVLKMQKNAKLYDSYQLAHSEKAGRSVEGKAADEKKS